MSLFDSASVVITPSGYKEDKLYSIKPTDGSGDLVVTRATTATRVNSDGLIEQVPYNLLLNSNNFNGSGWISSNVTITSGEPDPFGGNNAWKIVFSGGVNDSYIFQQVLNQLNCAQIWVKGTATKNVMLGIRANIGNGSPTTLTGEWQQVIESSVNEYFIISDYGVTNPVTTFYLYQAQVNGGATAKEYFPTTDRLDIPRLDYTNSSCPSILVEPQRTNLVTYSEQFDNSAWYEDNVSISANSVTSPSGIQNADSILETATTATHTTYNRASMTSGQAYTQSCYFKANGRNRVIMQIFDNATQYANAIFDLSSGVVVASFGTATIQNMTNGWYRCTITGTSPATGLGYCVIGLCENTYSTPSVFPTYLGDITKGVYAWGFQLEAGSYATSYIPTVASSVTRNADIISKTGISSLIGQAEGVMYFNFSMRANSGDNVSVIRLTGGSDELVIFGESSGNLGVYSSKTGLTYIEYGTAFDKEFKIAYAWKSNNYALYVNGLSISLSSAVNGFTTLQNIYINSTAIGSEIGKVIIKSGALWKTRLTNTELAQLTSL